MAIRQYQNSYDPFNTLAQSVVTGNPIPTMDAAMVVFSITSSSGTASRWTWLGYDGASFGAGLTSALPPVDTNNWQVIKAVSAQGYYSFDTLPRWAVMLRTPSNSSATVTCTVYVGP